MSRKTLNVEQSNALSNMLLARKQGQHDRVYNEFKHLYASTISKEYSDNKVTCFEGVSSINSLKFLRGRELFSEVKKGDIAKIGIVLSSIQGPNYNFDSQDINIIMSLTISLLIGFNYDYKLKC